MNQASLRPQTLVEAELPVTQLRHKGQAAARKRLAKIERGEDVPGGSGRQADSVAIRGRRAGPGTTSAARRNVSGMLRSIRGLSLHAAIRKIVPTGKSGGRWGTRL